MKAHSSYQRASITVFLYLVCSITSFGFDGWFDIYGKLRWEEEKVRLDNYAAVLLMNPELVGYVAVYRQKGDSKAELDEHIVRIKNHLIGIRGVEKNRIAIVRTGKSSEIRVILQPVDGNLPAPVFPRQ